MLKRRKKIICKNTYKYTNVSMNIHIKVLFI